MCRDAGEIEITSANELDILIADTSQVAIEVKCHMPPVSCANIDNDRVVDGNARFPLDEALFLAMTCLERFTWTERTLDVTLVELPTALIAIAAAIGVRRCLTINEGVLRVFNIKAMMLATDDFGL